MTAQEFKETLEVISSAYSTSIPKREMFFLAKEFQFMPVLEIIKLLQEESDDIRLGAVSIMDWKARNKKTSNRERKETYLAYINNHQFINNWGMVDRAAPYVVGGYLFEKPKDPLFKLARSNNPMERRTAIVSTYFFIRKNETSTTFKLAEILVNDKDEYVQKAVGSWIREAGKKDEAGLLKFLNQHAKHMPRVMLRYAIEKLSSPQKKEYLGAKVN